MSTAELLEQVYEVRRKINAIETALLENRPPVVSQVAQRIIEIVAEHTQVSADRILSPCREADVVDARSCVMLLLKEHTDMSLNRITKLLNRRHVGSVLYGLKAIEDHMETDAVLRKRVETMRASVKSVVNNT